MSELLKNMEGRHIDSLGTEGESHSKAVEDFIKENKIEAL
jgi:hypothetical protein